MRRGSLDRRYFDWLYSQVIPVHQDGSSRHYRHLLTQMHETSFVAIVAYDENRSADGKDLRGEFLDYVGEDAPESWSSYPCTMLELFVVLARKLAFEMDEEDSYWFRHLLENVRLDGYDDESFKPEDAFVIAQTLYFIIWRKYDKRGSGGLFPLKEPPCDQRDVELWYQLNAYLLERY